MSIRARSSRVGHQLGRAASAIVALGVGVLVVTSPVAADTVRLAGGDTITVKVIARDAERLVVEHAVLGRLVLSPDQVELVSSDRTEAAPRGDAYRQAETKRSNAVRMSAIQDEPPQAEAPTWKSSFTLGVSGSFGNTDTQNVTGGLNSKLDRGAEVTKLGLNYYLDMSNGDRTDNRFNADVRHDWLMPDSPWLYFVQGRYDYDEFQSWEHRASAHGGFGYRIIETDTHTVALRGGGGASKEWKSLEQELRPEVLFGADWDWAISEKQSLHLDTTVFPDLGNRGEFRTLTNINWSVLLDQEQALSLTTGIFHEYQSDVDATKDKNDLKVYVGLKFDF